MHEGVRNILQSQEVFLKDDQIFFCQLGSYIECSTSNCRYFVRQIQWGGQNPLWTSSLELGRSSMEQERFLKDDQISSVNENWLIDFDLPYCSILVTERLTEKLIEGWTD